MNDSLVSHTCQHLRVSVFQIFSYSNRYAGISHCCFDSNYPDDMMKHLFICLFAICMFSLVMCLLSSFVSFLIRFFTFSLSFKSSLYILYNSPLSNVLFENISSWSVACLHICQLPLRRVEVKLFSPLFMHRDNGISRKSLPCLSHVNFFYDIF